MIKLTLDEKYRYLVTLIRQSVNPAPQYDSFVMDQEEYLVELCKLWFGDQSMGNAYKVIERIHSADEIEWIAPKYNWRLKSEKFYLRYLVIDSGHIYFTTSKQSANAIRRYTESDLKKALEGTGLSFDAFERMGIDD